MKFSRSTLAVTLSSVLVLSACSGGDASCLMHLGGAMSRRGSRGADGSPLRTVHLAEILASTREEPLDVSGPLELSLPGGKATVRRRPSAEPTTTAPASAAQPTAQPTPEEASR